ncbi:MAG: hypothetical protein SWO11_00440 [Thermodesulfobacteriota bacterium]|nr:hypothetical protein [Thermodesulfobacteriota bacterium]
MGYVFLILLVFFILTTIFFTRDFRGKKIRNIVGHMFFLVSLCLNGKIVLSQETNIIFYALSGFVLGLLIFFISLFLTTLSFSEIIAHGLPFSGIFGCFIDRPLRAMTILIASIVEEFIWRAVIQDYFGRIYLGNLLVNVTLTAFLFSIVHKRILEGDILKKLEFLLFSLFLGYSFAVTHSLTFVILIHLMRNINIEYRNSVSLYRMKRTLKQSL